MCGGCERWNEVREGGDSHSCPSAYGPVPVVGLGLLVRVPQGGSEMGQRLGGTPRSDGLCPHHVDPQTCALHSWAKNEAGVQGRGTQQQQEIKPVGLGRHFLQVDTLHRAVVVSVSGCRLGHVSPMWTEWRLLRYRSCWGAMGGLARSVSSVEYRLGLKRRLAWF